VSGWCSALDELVRDEDLRRGLGRRARADVLEGWTEERRAEELWPEIERVVARRPATARVALDDAESETPAAIALEPDACPALPASEPAAATPPLGGGERLAQTFRPNRNGLCRVDVHAITYGQSLSHELRLALRNRDGRVVAEEWRQASQLPDRGWFALELAPEAGSSGEPYELELEAIGTGPGNAPSFGLAAAAIGERPDAAGLAAASRARLGSEPLAAPLALRAFAAWEHALAAAPSRGRGDRMAG
jgi:hypothetical protein